jgi:hypothetical protein
VAALAPLMRWTPFCIEGRLPVRRLLPTVVHILVACLAGLCADVAGGGRRGSGGRWALWFGLLGIGRILRPKRRSARPRI